jgi:ABC-type multidrug transport system permease subunit
VATYMFFLGGGFTTIVFLPAWLQTVSSFIPMRYAIDGMRQALFYSTLNGVTKDISVLYLTAMLCTILGSITLRRSWAN